MEIETANNRSIVVGTVAHTHTYMFFDIYTWEILISVKNIYDVSISNAFYM